MRPEFVGIIGMAVALLLMGIGLPIAFVFLLVGGLGVLYFAGTPGFILTITDTPWKWMNNYGLSAVILFVAMGSFLNYSGIGGDLFTFAYKLMGRTRGGVAMATVLGSGLFATVSGSSLANAACMGTMALPEMKRLKYADSLAAGVVAAGGTIGILIPPSIPLIMFGILTEESIGKLFMAGIIPGVMQVLLFILAVVMLGRVKPSWLPAGPRFPVREKLGALKLVWPTMILAGVVLGGLYMGIFTATEGGAIGFSVILLIVLIRRQINWKSFGSALANAGMVACPMFFIVMGAMIFNRFMTLSQAPAYVAGLGASWGLTSPYTVLLFAGVIYLILGCFMDPLAMLVLSLPMFLPLLEGAGVSLIFFGIFAVIMMEIGLITPPVGLNLFIVQSIAKDISFNKIVAGMVPFLAMDVVLIMVLVIFPQIVLFLPNAMIR